MRKQNYQNMREQQSLLVLGEAIIRNRRYCRKVDANKVNQVQRCCDVVETGADYPTLELQSSLPFRELHSETSLAKFRTTSLGT